MVARYCASQSSFQSLQEYPKLEPFSKFYNSFFRVSNPYRNILSATSYALYLREQLVSNPYRNILSKLLQCVENPCIGSFQSLQEYPKRIAGGGWDRLLDEFPILTGIS